MMDPTPDLKAATRPDLGVTRTALSAERTLMSWVRTALAMISFGFTIFKFMHALVVAHQLAPHHEAGPRNLGIALALLGTASLTAGTIQYRGVIRSLGGPRPGFTLYLGLAVIAVGLLVLLGLVLRVGPLA
jgi:putative membrane protein